MRIPHRGVRPSRPKAPKRRTPNYSLTTHNRLHKLPLPPPRKSPSKSQTLPQLDHPNAPDHRPATDRRESKPHRTQLHPKPRLLVLSQYLARAARSIKAPPLPSPRPPPRNTAQRRRQQQQQQQREREVTRCEACGSCCYDGIGVNTQIVRGRCL